jgi:hypothetical protein
LKTSALTYLDTLEYHVSFYPNTVESVDLSSSLDIIYYMIQNLVCDCSLLTLEVLCNFCRYKNGTSVSPKKKSDLAECLASYKKEIENLKRKIHQLGHGSEGR